MSLQPVSGLQWRAVAGTALGTVNLTTDPTNLVRIVMPASATGTLAIYDSSTGATGSSFTVVNDTVDFPTTIELGVQLKNGLSYVTSGTTNALIIYN